MSRCLLLSIFLLIVVVTLAKGLRLEQKYEEADNIQSIASSFQGAQYTFLLPDFLAQINAKAASNNNGNDLKGVLPLCDAGQKDKINRCGLGGGEYPPLITVHSSRKMYSLPTGLGRLLNDVLGDGNGFEIQSDALNKTIIADHIAQFCGLYENFVTCIEGLRIEETCIGRNIKLIQIIAGYSCSVKREDLQDIIWEIGGIDDEQLYEDYISVIPGCFYASIEDVFRSTKYAWLRYEDIFSDYTQDEVTVMMEDVCISWHHMEMCYIRGYSRMCGSKCQRFFSGLLLKQQKSVKDELMKLGPKYAKLGSCEQHQNVLNYPQHQHSTLQDFIDIGSTIKMLQKFVNITLKAINASLPYHEKEYGVCSATVYNDRRLMCIMQGLSQFKYQGTPYSVVDLADRLCKSTVKNIVSCWTSYSKTCGAKFPDNLVNYMQTLCELTDMVKNNASLLTCVPLSAMTFESLNFKKLCGVRLSELVSRYMYMMETTNDCSKITSSAIRKYFEILPCMMKAIVNVVVMNKNTCGEKLLVVMKQLSNEMKTFFDTFASVYIASYKEICCGNVKTYPICTAQN